MIDPKQIRAAGVAIGKLKDGQVEAALKRAAAHFPKPDRYIAGVVFSVLASELEAELEAKPES